jgi:hypothetical protein
MMKRKWMISGALVASLLLAGIVVAAPSSPSIDRWVMGSGGGSGTAGSTALNSTIGQWMVGSGTSGSTQLGSGFWGGGEMVYPPSHVTYLPLVLRGAP